MIRRYTATLVQMDTQDHKEKNMEFAVSCIREAASRGAKLICFPEVMNLIGRNVGEGGGRETIPGYSTEILMQAAKEQGVYIHGGSITEEIPGERQTYNTSVMIDPAGKIIAEYRKLHMFDITLADGTPFLESERVRPGSEIVTVETELGVFGMSICYDIRFPELYRLMALRGAQILMTPASFTMPTGKDHWETILRTRAIENGCYVLAPGQIGKKPQYIAYGNSLAVDPWGTVTARAKDRPGIVYTEIDLDYLDEVRRQIPSLKNRREDVYRLNMVSDLN